MVHPAAGSFDPLLVGVSILVAISGAYLALELVERSRASGRRVATIWLAGAATVFAASVWTMHFIGMLAWHAPVDVTYDTGLTAASLAAVLALSWTGFALTARGALGRWTIPASGAVAGGGVCAMHYLGMAAMLMPAALIYEPGLVALSAFCAFSSATFALWISFRRLHPTRRVIGAAALGLGVAGMHYIAMAAADLRVAGSAPALPLVGLSRPILATAVAVGAAGILSWVVIGSVLERRRVDRAAADQEAWRRSIVETAVDAILVIDERGKVLAFNPAAERAFGYAAEEVLGRNVKMLMPEPHQSSHDGYLDRYIRTGERRIIGIGRDTEARRKDGSTFPIELSVAEWRADKVRYFTGILRDVTERREAEREQRRLREALEAEKALLKAIVDRLPSGLIVAEAPAGRILLQNATADRLLGYPAAPIETVADYAHLGIRRADGERLRAEDYPLARALFEGVEIDQEEIVYPRADGHLVSLAVNAAPVRQSSGNIRLAIATFNDVTDRRALETALRESEARYRSLVESQADLVIRFDATRRVTLVNDAVCRTLGRGREALIGTLWDDMIDAATLEETRAALEGADRILDRRMSIENRVLTAAGPRWFLWQGSAIFDEAGRAVETQAVGRDITERKAAEEERAAAKEAAEQANLAKSKFLAAASHDLRQPMQSLFFVSNALGPHVGEDGRAHLALLETGLRSLKHLLDSLLDVSRIDSGAVEPRFEDIALPGLFEEIAATSRPAAEQKGLILRTEAPTGLTVRSDRTLLERILRNLVENAIRYTERGEVSIVAETEGDRARIDVRDTGVGVPPEHQGRIFEEFHQVGNPSRDRAQGLGLGLAIVRRLSDLLDHPVALFSTVGEGSIFSIRAPLGRREFAPATLAKEPESSSPPRTILAIDDDALVLMGVEAMLEEWGHRVLAAFGAEDAVQLLDETGARPDLIVCDYRLGQGRFGTEAVRLVREHLGADTPALILTGETSTSGRVDIQRAGAAFAHKPITPQALQQAIERQLTTVVECGTA